MEWTETRTERAWRALPAVVLLAATLHAAPAAAAPTPAASAVTGGNYTVSYAGCGCLNDWLEERTGGGSWAYAGQGGSVAFAGKPIGVYYYRVGNLMGDYWSAWNEYGAEIMVTVGPPPVPAEPLSTQLRYLYDIRYSDANGDGLLDLFVQRSAGGARGDGAIDAVMLLQTGGGRFTSTVPSESLMVTAASSWPRALTRIVLQDFNADGFADLLLKGVGNSIGGALDQIIYAPGRPGALQPLGTRAVDAGLKRFVANSRDYFADTSYFEENAPLGSAVVPISYFYCAPTWDYDYSYGYAYSYCGWFTYYYSVQYRDYSAFDSTAVDAWSTEASIEAHTISPAQGVATIAQTYEALIGAPIGGRDDTGLNGERARLDDPTYRKGFDLVIAVLGIHDAQADELDPPRNPARRADIVYVTGRRVLGFLPLHTALEYNGSTLSAFDSDESLLGNGVLVSRPNAASDRAPMMMTLGTVSSGLGAPTYWSSLVSADARYPDNLPYNPVPSTGSGYNSNGFTHGLVQATGGTPSIDMNKYVGGERPVPANLFH